MTVSAAKLEANRRNAARSTGPRTEEGKERAKFNALKHGMRAETPVLHDEDPQALEARKASWAAALGPRNDVEQRAVDDAVAFSWMQDRARRAQAARLNANFADHGVAEAKAIAKDVEDLGRRLFADRMGPLAFYPTGCDYDDGTCDRIASTSFAGEGEKDPDHPADLVLDLQSTLRGCEWLLKQWVVLKAILDRGQPWISSDKLKAVRLLGKQPFDAIDDRDVAMVFLASFVLKGEKKGRWHWEILMEMNDQDTERFEKNAVDRQLKSLMPANADKAREALLEIIARATEPLTAQAEAHRQRAEAKAARAADILAFDDSDAGERLRRHELAASRGMARSLEILFKNRRTAEHQAARPPAREGEPLAIAPSREGEACREGEPLREGEAPTEPGDKNDPNGRLENTTNEPKDSDALGPFPPPSGPAGHLPARGGEGNVNNEPTEPDSLRPCSPPSGPAGHLPRRGGEGNSTNEPTDLGQNATNEPSGYWDDPRLNAEIDWHKTAEWLRQGIEQVRQNRAEQLRQLNEQARQEREMLKAARSARRAARTNRKPTGRSRERKRKKTVSADEHLECLADQSS
jgi:hypothetical protein